MTYNEDLIDKNNFLTVKGREIVQLVLQDENESLRFFICYEMISDTVLKI